MYYAINEEAARRAHVMNSHREYKDGQTTREYQSQVEDAAKIAELQKAKVDPMYHGKIDGLLDAYSRKLADWYNKKSSIEQMCPSIMISGGSKFPVRKKEKQNAARERHHKEWENIKGLLHKIESVGTGGISADDPDALGKLKAKLSFLEENQEFMKSVNTYYRKHKTLENYPGLDTEQARRIQTAIELDWRQNKKPFQGFELTNNNANIKRIKERIIEIEKRSEKPLEGWSFDGGEVVANTYDNRLQILFEGKPDEALRMQLKQRGFRWAPSAGAWQRQLTNNAVHAAKAVLTSASEG